MRLLELFAAFAKIGLFTFGGGYGMIPLIQQEVAARGWLDEATLYRFIGVSESTPGPIAVNMATFIGARQAGMVGAACATLGVVLPSFVVILLVASLFRRFSENRFVRAAMKGVKPVVAGMIAATGACVLIKCLADVSGSGTLALDIRQMAVMAALILCALAWKKRFKKPLSPIAMIAISAILGAVFNAI